MAYSGIVTRQHTDPIDESDQTADVSRWSGRTVVAMMFAFGIVVVSGFWTYWALYDRPLAPLRRAIAADHPDLFVQIAAGRAKKSELNELRIVVQTPFDPHRATGQTASVADSIRSHAVSWDQIDRYDRLEIILYESLGESRDAYWSDVVELPQTRSSTE